ncbi:MAG: hypothetical protein ACI4RA_10870 [Kiritimatiellia bacterium]
MQIITMYLRTTSVKATHVDEWNQPVSALPALTRGLRAELVLKLIDENGLALTDEQLAYASWDFAVANDWDTETTPQLRVTEGITVSDNEVHIPLTETNTEELIAALGKNEQSQFGCELAGFTAGETSPEFLIQFDILVRNRRADAGTGRPEPVGDASYSAAQIRALFAAKMELQYMDGGGVWHDADGQIPPRSAVAYHYRNSSAKGDWSDPIPIVPGPTGSTPSVGIGAVTALGEDEMPTVVNSGTSEAAVLDFGIPRGKTGVAATVRVGTVDTLEPGEDAEITNSGTDSAAVLDFRIPRGPKGDTGHESFIYVAYASKSDGSGFSLAPANTLKYRAEILREEPIDSPTAADFLGATWVKYLGDDATVYGDVLVADSDTSVSKVSRIVFENAHIRKGVDGEVIVNFKDAGTTNEEMCRYAVINGRTRLSSWTNGGGSQSAVPGMAVETHSDIAEMTRIEEYSTFIGIKE